MGEPEVARIRYPVVYPLNSDTTEYQYYVFVNITLIMNNTINAILHNTRMIVVGLFIVFTRVMLLTRLLSHNRANVSTLFL